MLKKLKNSNAFTLIELLVVMAIIAILMTLIVYAIQATRRAQRDTQRRANARSIKAALEAYFVTNKEYPDTSQTTLSGIDTMLGDYLGSDDLTDPIGDDDRYCYMQNSGTAYVLRIWMEGMGESAPGEHKPTCDTDPAVAEGESFDMAK